MLKQVVAILISGALCHPQTLPLLGAGKAVVTAGGGGTWTLTQFKYFDTASGGTGGSTCTQPSSTCTVTMSAPTAGHLLIVVQFWDGTATTTTPTGGQTWTHATGAAVGSTSKIDAWYALSATATGQTTAICHLSANASNFQSCQVYEYAWSGSTIGFNAAGGTEDASCTSCAAVTLTGTFNLAIQTAWSLNASTGVTAIGGTNGASYTNPKQFYSSTANAGWINATSGTAPTWTVSGAAATGVMGITFNGT